MPINVSLWLPSLAFANAKALTFVCVMEAWDSRELSSECCDSVATLIPLPVAALEPHSRHLTAVRYMFIAQSVRAVTALSKLRPILRAMSSNKPMNTDNSMSV